MISTRKAIQLIRDANLGADLTEDRVRHVLRREEIPSPSKFSGRLAWTDDDVDRLADALALRRPRAPEANHAS